MAAGWLTALKLVPWSDVITLAPKVLDGAKSLRDAVARRGTAVPVSTEAPAASPEAVAECLQALSAATATLQTQMAETTELLRSVAEQNAQLVAQLERLQRRSRGLTLVSGLALAGAALALWRAWA